MDTQIANPLNLSTYRFETFFKVYQDSDTNQLYYNILKNVNILAANDNTVEDAYTVAPHDTWVYISYKYYKTIDLWWLVCEYNGITNPTQMPEVGTTLKLLKAGYVYNVLSELYSQFNR